MGEIKSWFHSSHQRKNSSKKRRQHLFQCKRKIRFGGLQRLNIERKMSSETVALHFPTSKHDAILILLSTRQENTLKFFFHSFNFREGSKVLLRVINAHLGLDFSPRQMRCARADGTIAFLVCLSVSDKQIVAGIDEGEGKNTIYNFMHLNVMS